MKLRLFLATWCAGLPGVIAMAWLGLPGLLEGTTLPAPLWVLGLVSAIQSALLLALAAFAGAALAPKVGLGAPVIAAWVESRPTWRVLQTRLLPGALGGLLGGALLGLLVQHAPQAADPLQRVSLPLAVRLLYGGITEEVLVRWGLMSAIVWVLWRIFQQGSSKPLGTVVWMAIAGSALLFGAGHLPAAMALVGTPSLDLVVYVVGANASFGLIAGYLFWRFGLESAMVAHLLAHLVLALSMQL